MAITFGVQFVLVKIRKEGEVSVDCFSVSAARSVNNGAVSGLARNVLVIHHTANAAATSAKTNIAKETK